ncbi:MAG: hypothetical protein R3F59_26360 [Myxococcota bacterium]
MRTTILTLALAACYELPIKDAPVVDSGTDTTVTDTDPQPAPLAVSLDGTGVSGTGLSGTVDDPQFTPPDYDLATQTPVDAVVTCDGDTLALTIGWPSDVTAFGGNELHATFTLVDGVPTTAEGALVQWADFDAYDGEFSRSLPALEGSAAELTDAAGLCGAAPAPFSGVVTLVTAAGTAVGTFVAEAP